MDSPFLIFGSDLQIVQILIKSGETVYADPGAYCYSSDNITADPVEAETMWSYFCRMLGEGFQLYKYGNRSQTSGYIGFGARQPGKIIPIDLQTRGPMMFQTEAYLCSTHHVHLEAHVVTIDTGILGGEGILMQKISGEGICFVQAGGAIIEKDLEQDEVLIVDTTCIIGVAQTCEFQVEYIGTIQTAIMGGKPLFASRIKGPGLVLIQSLPLSRLAQRVMKVGFKGSPGTVVAGSATVTRLLRIIMGILGVTLIAGTFSVLYTIIDEQGRDL